MPSTRNQGIVELQLADDCDWEDACITQALQVQVWLVCQGPQAPDPVKNYGRKYMWINMLGTHHKITGVL